MNKKRILVVDDEEDIAEVISIALQDDYEIAILHSIQDPVNDINAINPDLILLDLWIPEIGGEQVLSELKKHNSTSKVPVIVISADNQAPEIAERNNADAFLAKPFKILTLKKLIEEALKKE